MLLIWGLDQEGKKLKKGLLSAGTDRAAAKELLCLYKKIRKSNVEITTHYHKVKELANRILTESRELEQLLIREQPLPAQEAARVREILKDFTKSRPLLDFEFVISHADKDIHLTMEGMEKLGISWLEGKTDRLILQSETENLIALVREAQEKVKPDLCRLTVFYQNHTDRELEEISYTSRLMLVDDVYRKEYLEKYREPVQKAIDSGYLPEAGKDAEEYLNRLIRI